MVKLGKFIRLSLPSTNPNLKKKNLNLFPLWEIWSKFYDVLSLKAALIKI